MSNNTLQVALRNNSQPVVSTEQTKTSRGTEPRLTMLRSDKITDNHLQRLAIVYVRQSTQQQVFEHRESTARQYALADRAVALGWPAAAVQVIDEDQGHSGSSAEGRSGFQRLLAEVCSDRVGIILGLRKCWPGSNWTSRAPAEAAASGIVTESPFGATIPLFGAANRESLQAGQLPPETYW